MKSAIAGLLLIPLSFVTSAADWNVANDESKVNFVSIKKGDIAEVHHFKTISGMLNEKGEFKLTVSLASVDTSIEIRDERMGSLLFEVDKFPKLTLTAQVDTKLLASLSVGDSTITTVEGLVDLHGKKVKLPFMVSIAKLSDSNLLVASAVPVIVNSDSFGLTQGVEKLREIAGLSAISKAVPVSFILNLKK
ncbi:YceI family protein [Shewanella kaireitica]|uniref:YceI family protein n=1 Tax=Shewanella kaireitica TaxID=212021 RepID=UPI00200C5BE4|nr:YceI family protein [Shewanella kaireitica]MCL1094734.1 YceI family protein [Shewanella kaireitica]